jgi:hypothetical protein
MAELEYFSAIVAWQDAQTCDPTSCPLSPMQPRAAAARINRLTEEVERLSFANQADDINKAP